MAVNTIHVMGLVFAAALCLAGANERQTPTTVEPPAPDVAGEQNARNFVQIADRRAIIHCGEAEIHLNPDQGFSLAVASKIAGALQPLLTSTSVRLRLDGRDQMVVSRGYVANAVILEEGPQRVALRAPFTLSTRDGRPVATAQYDVVCYPEGEVFVTLRVLPLREGIEQAAIELRFIGNDMLQFERSYDLPLVIGNARAGQAVGFYWHNGEAPVMGVIGGQMRCLFLCQAEGESDADIVSRTFVVSVARSRDELRWRCVAHIQPLRPHLMRSCRGLVETSPETREIVGELPGWCYSFRDGTYNLLADGPQAMVELDNPHDEGRHVRVRFVARGSSALNIAGDNSAPCRTLQLVSLTPDLEVGDARQSSAALADFDIPAYGCFLARAESDSRFFFLQFVAARITQGATKRLYRIVTSDPRSRLAEIQVAEGGASAGVEITSLAAPAANGRPAVAALSAMPRPTEAWGRFSRLTDLAIVKNQPNRAVLQIKALNEAQTLSCRSDLVFRRENEALALYGYHAVESLESARQLRPTTLDLPTFRISGGEDATTAPLRFFYADHKKRIQICPRLETPGFGYDLGSFNRSVHQDFALCGFAGGTSAGLVFLGRPVVGTGKMTATESSPTLSMRLDFPAVVSRGQRFESMWKMVVPGTGETNLRTLQAALGSLKGDPVDLGWFGKRITVSDGQIAHRVFELSPSGNPASDDGWCYLIDGGDEMAVVGAGADALRWPWMFRIRALGLDPSRVRKVLLTDAGADHAGGTRALKQLTGAAVYLHATAIEAVSVGGPEQDQRTGAPWRCESGRFDSASIDRPLRDGETIRVGDLAVRFLHTPGPTGESGAYLVNAGGLSAAFVGDLLAAGDGASTLPGGRADAHTHGNLDEWARSLKRLRAENVDLAAPSHSPPLSGTRQINLLCDRTSARTNAVLRVKNVDYILPRPLVAGRDLRGDTSQSIVRDDLWGVKEVERPAVARTRPVEIANCMWRVGGGFAGENEDANVYLLDGGSEMALIGAGSGLHTRAILGRILGLGKNPLSIKYILLPSSHWYEARGANSLRVATGARVCAHRQEAAALWRGDVLRTGLMIGDFLFAAFPPCRVDRLLEWGETIRVGQHEIIVLDAPGFHRGSTAFLMTIDGLRFLAAGQTALGDLPLPDDDVAEGAMGWLDPHWGGNVPAWKQTIERYLTLQPDVVLPGQGPAQDEELERQLRECLARLEQIQAIQKAGGLFPQSLFDMTAALARPDITRLKPKR
jgi:glyoxylase-like metal-dependent hydrolase (beta-lactamase superfamily II)